MPDSSRHLGSAIIHVIDSEGLYGAERVVLELAEAQRAGGWRPHLLSLRRIGDARRAIEIAADERGIPVEVLDSSWLGSLALGPRIHEVGARLGVRVIHSHGYKSDIALGLVSAPGGVRRISTLHGWTTTRRLSVLGAYRTLQLLALRRFDAVVAVARSVLDLIPTGLRRAVSCEVVPNGIRDPAANTRCFGELLDSARPRVLYAGRLSEEKGILDLLEAMSGDPACLQGGTLLIAGDGPLSGTVAQRLRELSVTSCVLGFRGDLPEILRHVDCLVMPSRTEGLPILLLEAMWCGTPIVATAVGAVEHVLEGGHCGRLVAPNDPDAIAAAIGSVLEDPRETARRRDRARLRVEQRFSATAMRASYDRVYLRESS